MAKARMKKGLGRKAFISDFLVEALAIFLFVVVVLIFWFIYKWSAAERLQELEGKRDLIYGNYLAQAYLRTPISVGGEQMTVAELIAMYDYNQTLEQSVAEERSFVERLRFIIGVKNPMRDALIGITDDFVDENFDRGKCFLFSIHGAAFDYSRKSDGCTGSSAFGVNSMLRQVGWLPNETFMTYIPSVDPRDEPIVLYSIYDFTRMLSVYSPDPYFDMSDAERAAFEAPPIG